MTGSAPFAADPPGRPSLAAGEGRPPLPLAELGGALPVEARQIVGPVELGEHRRLVVLGRGHVLAAALGSATLRRRDRRARRLGTFLHRSAFVPVTASRLVLKRRSGSRYPAATNPHPQPTGCLD